MPTLLQVALGGAIGASLRYGLGLSLLGEGFRGFPMAVLTANVLGSFLMGMLFVFLTEREFLHFAPFLMVGVLGGFTTFSSFSLETFNLFERGDWGQAALYVGLSVGLSLGALFVGLLLGRSIWA